MTEKQQELAAVEKELARKQAATYLSTEQFDKWQDCRFTFRTHGHYNKLFTLWELEDSKPKVLGGVRVLEPSASRRNGLEIRLSIETDSGRSEIVVSHSPTPIFGDKVFCHIPFMAVCRYVPVEKTGAMLLRMPLVFKTEGKPWEDDTGVRLTALGEFRAAFPEFAGLVL